MWLHPGPPSGTGCVPSRASCNIEHALLSIPFPTLPRHGPSASSSCLSSLTPPRATCGYLFRPSLRCCVCVPFLSYFSSPIAASTVIPSLYQLVWLPTFFSRDIFSTLRRYNQVYYTSISSVLPQPDLSWFRFPRTLVCCLTNGHSFPFNGLSGGSHFRQRLRRVIINFRVSDLCAFQTETNRLRFLVAASSALSSYQHVIVCTNFDSWDIPPGRTAGLDSTLVIGRVVENQRHRTAGSSCLQPCR